jgi:hypothetical protein
MRRVAALYVDPRGPYPKMADVDAWDETRDARAYDGPRSVVAHPPCGPWGRLRHLYKGLELDCALLAVEQVRKFGGVLEHPAGSKLWDYYSLQKPHGFLSDGSHAQSAADAYGGYTIELSQCEWGHVARKRTWLYLVRVPRSALEAPPFPGREPTHWLSGSRGKSSRTGNPVPTGIKVCSAAQRRRTPPLFAEYLVRLARSAT